MVERLVARGAVYIPEDVYEKIGPDGALKLQCSARKAAQDVKGKTGDTELTSAIIHPLTPTEHGYNISATQEGGNKPFHNKFIGIWSEDPTPKKVQSAATRVANDVIRGY